MSITGTPEYKSHGCVEHVDVELGRENLHGLYEKDKGHLQKVITRSFTKRINSFQTQARNKVNNFYNRETHTFQTSPTGEKIKPDHEDIRDFNEHVVSGLAKEFVGEEKDKEASVRDYLLHKLSDAKHKSTEEDIEKGPGSLHSAHQRLNKVLTKIYDGTFRSSEDKAQKKNERVDSEKKQEIEQSESDVEEEKNESVEIDETVGVTLLKIFDVGEEETVPHEDFQVGNESESAIPNNSNKTEESIEEQKFVEVEEKTPYENTDENTSSGSSVNFEELSSLDSEELDSTETGILYPFVRKSNDEFDVADDDETEEKKASSVETPVKEASVEEKASSQEASAKEPSVEEKVSSQEASAKEPSVEEKASSQEASVKEPSVEEKVSSQEASSVETPAKEASVEEKASSQEASAKETSVEKEASSQESSAKEASDEVIKSEESAEPQSSVKTEEKKTPSGISGFFMRIGKGFENIFVSIYNWFKKLFS